jgi:uncharacterized iron-regulated membrane protein
MWRRALFQIHLWGGLALGVYAVLIGLTGSALVFHEELVSQVSPLPVVAETSPVRGLEAIRAGIAAEQAGWHVWGLETPEAPGRPWRAFIQQGSTFRTVYADAQGRVVGELTIQGTWLHLVERFHSALLIPRGRLINGIAGLGLVALALSGLLLWWPARGAWPTAFRIVRRSSWKGLVYDLHRVGGALAFVFVVVFGVTGGSFTFRAAYRAITSSVLPTTPKPTPGPVTPSGNARPVDDLVRAAQQAVPETTLVRVLVPWGGEEPVTVELAHGNTPADRARRVSHVSVNAYSGEVVAADDFRNYAAGDHVLNWMAPLHAGHFGGFWVKVLWALAGLALPGLFVTGFLMWCNRVLAPRLSRSER